MPTLIKLVTQCTLRAWNFPKNLMLEGKENLKPGALPEEGLASQEETEHSAAKGTHSKGARS